MYKRQGLLSTAAGRTQEDKNKILTVIKLMEEKGVPQTLPTLVKRWFTDDFIKKFPEILIHEYYLKKGIQLEISQIKLGGL